LLDYKSWSTKKMQILKFDNEQEWLEARRGRITGTRLKDLVSVRDNKKKIGFYELLAERIAIPHNGENVMDRGKRLEDEAVERFAKETGKKVDNSLVMWVSDENDGIAVSPDASVGKTEAVEVKCLSSARHIEAYCTKQVPDEYRYQSLQYFIVNERLRALHFVFYDPRMPIDFFYITIKRKDIAKEINEYLELERKILEEVALIEKRLTF